MSSKRKLKRRNPASGAWIEDISNYYINNKECYCKECFDELEEGNERNS